MYFVTATHYLTGIAPGLLMFVPALEIFFDLRPVNLAVDWWQWVLFYSGFYVLQILLAAVIAGTFRWEVLLLSLNSFPIYIKALVNAWLKVDTKWSVTGTTGGAASAFNFIHVQIYAFVFLACTTVVSIWRDQMMGTFNVATFWCTVNTVSLGTFLVVAALEDRDRRLRAKGKRHSPRRIHFDDGHQGRTTEPLNADSIEQARSAKIELALSVKD